MIKPKYKKGMDFSQIVRSIVEHATGVPLIASKPSLKAKSPAKKKLRAS
jgi:hypothetical protein